MSSIRDLFIKNLDESEKGINGLMSRFMDKIRNTDPKVYERLIVEQDIKPQYFSFRWLTLMLSQEFPLPDVLRIWDSLLSDETHVDFLLDVCTAMVIVVRDDILTNDFAENMKLLQVSCVHSVIMLVNKDCIKNLLCFRTFHQWIYTKFYREQQLYQIEKHHR